MLDRREEVFLGAILEDARRLGVGAPCAPPVLRRIAGSFISRLPDDQRAARWAAASSRLGFCPPDPERHAQCIEEAIRAHTLARGAPDTRDPLAARIPMAMWGEALRELRPDLLPATGPTRAFADCLVVVCHDFDSCDALPPEAIHLALSPRSDEERRALVSVIDAAADAIDDDPGHDAIKLRRGLCLMRWLGGVLEDMVPGDLAPRVLDWLDHLVQHPVLLSWALQCKGARAADLLEHDDDGRVLGTLVEGAWYCPAALRRELAAGMQRLLGSQMPCLLNRVPHLTLLATVDLNAARDLIESARRERIPMTRSHERLPYDADLDQRERATLHALDSFWPRSDRAARLNGAVLLRHGKAAVPVALGGLDDRSSLDVEEIAEGVAALSCALALDGAGIDPDGTGTHTCLAMLLGSSDEELRDAQVRVLERHVWLSGRLFAAPPLPTCPQTQALAEDLGRRVSVAQCDRQMGWGVAALLLGNAELTRVFAATALASLETSGLARPDGCRCFLDDLTRGARRLVAEPPVRDLVIRIVAETRRPILAAAGIGAILASRRHLDAPEIALFSTIARRALTEPEWRIPEIRSVLLELATRDMPHCLEAVRAM